MGSSTELRYIDDLISGLRPSGCSRTGSNKQLRPVRRDPASDVDSDGLPAGNDRAGWR